MMPGLDRIVKLPVLLVINTYCRVGPVLVCCPAIAGQVEMCYELMLSRLLL